MFKKIIIASLLLLSGCATPQTILKNEDGSTVTCGGSSTGSIVGGAIGYSIQRSNDDDCVKKYISDGYKPVKIGDTQVQ